jgi:ElaB/YqjD/DUF883 family membrane-anchored ribosome-binding protein
MEKTFGSGVEDQLRNAVREAEKAGEGVKKGFDEAVSRGKEAAGKLGVDAREVADGAREYLDSARRQAGKAAERVTAYADDNTALVAVAAFGIGLLVGHLVTRKS